MFNPIHLAPYVVVAGALAGPPVFSDLSYSEAKSQAARQERLFIVDATAVWCGPCKAMDREVWVDDQVESWIGEHAVAVQVDVDEQREIAAELGIRAMPTIIAFRGDKEVDRVVGYQNAEQLLDWMAGADQGTSRLDDLIAKVNADTAAGRVDVDERQELASALAMSGRGDEAVEHYVWLWKNMLEYQPSAVGVRVSFMASDMANLVHGGHGRPEFTALREETEARLKQKPSWEDLGDWITLNEIIGDDAATLAWVDRNIADKEGIASIQRFSYKIESLLLKHERWSQYGTILHDPVRQFTYERNQARAAVNMMSQMLGEEELAIARAESHRTVQGIAARFHAALVAAGRAEQAKAVFDEALKDDDSDEMREAIRQAHLDINGAPLPAYLADR